jgi:hypothetical protein
VLGVIVPMQVGLGWRGGFTIQSRCRDAGDVVGGHKGGRVVEGVELV